MVSLVTHICVTRPQWVNAQRCTDLFMVSYNLYSHWDIFIYFIAFMLLFTSFVLVSKLTPCTLLLKQCSNHQPWSCLLINKSSIFEISTARSYFALGYSTFGKRTAPPGIASWSFSTKRPVIATKLSSDLVNPSSTVKCSKFYQPTLKWCHLPSKGP